MVCGCYGHRFLGTAQFSGIGAAHSKTTPWWHPITHSISPMTHLWHPPTTHQIAPVTALALPLLLLFCDDFGTSILPSKGLCSFPFCAVPSLAVSFHLNYSLSSISLHLFSFLHLIHLKILFQIFPWPMELPLHICGKLQTHWIWKSMYYRQKVGHKLPQVRKATKAAGQL
jgi:hypothetical protein